MAPTFYTFALSLLFFSFFFPSPSTWSSPWHHHHHVMIFICFTTWSVLPISWSLDKLGWHLGFHQFTKTKLELSNAPRKKWVARKDILGQANDLPYRPRGWKNPRVFQWLHIILWRKIQRLGQVLEVWSSTVQERAIRWGYQDQRRSRKGRLAYSSNHLEEEKFDVEWKCLFQLYQKCSLDVQMLTMWTM